VTLLRQIEVSMAQGKPFNAEELKDKISKLAAE